MTKFVRVYNKVTILKELGVLLKDLLEHVCELYKVKHLKQFFLKFIYYWLILKDVLY